MLSHPHLFQACGWLLLLRYWSWQDFTLLLASVVLHQEDLDVHFDSFLFLTLGSIWVHFCMSSNMLLHLCSFCNGLNSTSDSNLLKTEQSLIDMLDTVFYSTCCPRISFVQPQVCIPLTVTGELLIALGSPEPNLCPISCHPVLVFPCTTHGICTSQGLFYLTKVEFLLLYHSCAVTKVQQYHTAMSKTNQNSHRHRVRRKTAVTAKAS